MSKNIISGFADEIDSGFENQLETVSKLGMKHICLRSANGKNIADHTPGEAREELLPLLKAHGIGVSCLGSPIGKIELGDDDALRRQMEQLETLCAVAGILECRSIRVFSFYMPEGGDPDAHTDAVVERMCAFVRVAQSHGVVLVHENEKDIFGDTGRRCRTLLDAVDSPWLKAAFDPANFVQCGEDPEECWELLGGQVADIHIKDALRGGGDNVLCGTGDGRIPQLLRRAIRDEGYRGPLTLEPHLVLFDALQSLEKQDAAQVIKTNKARDGAEGYAMQHGALLEILDSI